MIRTLLVDDEQPARLRLRGLLDEHDDVEVVGEAEDGQAAVEQVSSLRPDVVFLDIQMPGLDGMQVASALEPPRPRVVFCTAFDHYAVDAFEHHAMAYLLKPLNRSRLAQVLDRVRLSIREQCGREQELGEATLAQSRLFPRTLPPMRRLDYAGICRAARGVGGDFYDFISLGPGRLGIVLGDVSGKGLGAGILMASLQARVQSLAVRSGERPGPMLEELNRLLHDTTEDNRFATLFYAIYDDERGSLTYVNAGHHPPLLLSTAAGTRLLASSGPPVGMFAESRYDPRRLPLHDGDVLAIYSDGVTETEDRHGREFGTSGIEAVVERSRKLPTSELPNRIVAELDRHLDGNERMDDVTVVVARYAEQPDASSAG